MSKPTTKPANDQETTPAIGEIVSRRGTLATAEVAKAVSKGAGASTQEADAAQSLSDLVEKQATDMEKPATA